MNVIIYGLGRRYSSNKALIESVFRDYNLLYSDKNYKGLSARLGIDVISPENIAKNDYKYVVVTVAEFEKVQQELGNLGVSYKRIISLKQVICIYNQGNFIYYPSDNENEQRKKVLIINGNLGFHGGAIACANLGKALIKKGYKVDIACGSGDIEVLKWFNAQELGVYVFKSYPYIGGEDSKAIRCYDIVVANTISTIRAALFTYKIVPTIWWIHEAEDYLGNNLYSETIKEFGLINDGLFMEKTKIIAVSKRASEAFYKAFKKDINVVTIGIPDERKSIKKIWKNKIIIATIGYIREDKNQLSFMKVAESIDSENVSFLVIGSALCQSDYYHEMLKIEAANENISILHEVSKDTLVEMYADIDVIVCPSYIESMSMTIIEGMMNSKICITTDGTGISDYIEDGVNGYVCKAGDIESLRYKIQYVIDHFDELDNIRKNGRKTYEKYFNSEILGDNFEGLILETMDNFKFFT